ncbi:MAG: acetylxylan esterase [Chthoniobacterales bacterium]
MKSKTTLPPQAAEFLKSPIDSTPRGFENFWRSTYEKALRIPLNITRRKISSSAKARVYEFECDSLGGFRIGGWIIEPADGKWERGIVMGHGYGGRAEPELSTYGPPAVLIQPCMRGFHRSAHPSVPDECPKHVLHEINNREKYILRGCVADIWVAASVLLSLYQEVRDKLDYIGGSFGGGLGAMSLAWDSRFRRAFLDVPTFGNQRERLQTPCFGSGEPVRLRYEKDPSLLKKLRWYDSAIAAHWIKIPTFVAAALSDPNVPPIGQFAVYKGLGGKKDLFVRKEGHPNVLSDDKKLRPILDTWFS